MGAQRGIIFFFNFLAYLVIFNRNLSSFLQRIFHLLLTSLDRNKNHPGIKSLVMCQRAVQYLGSGGAVLG